MQQHNIYIQQFLINIFSYLIFVSIAVKNRVLRQHLCLFLWVLKNMYYFYLHINSRSSLFNNSIILSHDCITILIYFFQNHHYLIIAVVIIDIIAGTQWSEELSHSTLHPTACSCPVASETRCDHTLEGHWLYLYSERSKLGCGGCGLQGHWMA